MKDGKNLLRGPTIKIPAYRGENKFTINPEAINTWAKDGWVDLRLSNVILWQKRMNQIFDEIESVPADDTSSQFIRDRTYWLEDDEIDIGKVVGWIFSHEEQGLRMKD
ncbi:MAG: hypothetical protein E2O79_03130 [Caldithrix sp.]|nr:MAG: hypothetical protein E2O79_03130 [Caldithrix sp.]